MNILIHCKALSGNLFDVTSSTNKMNYYYYHYHYKVRSNQSAATHSHSKIAPIIFLGFYFDGLTWVWPVISSAHFCHCGHLSRSSNVVSLDVQQHCSWLYQKADRHTPSFRSVIQSTARSMTPASVPEGPQQTNEPRSSDYCFSLNSFSPGASGCATVASRLTWEQPDEQHHHPSRPGVQQALDQLPEGLFALTGDLDEEPRFQKIQQWQLTDSPQTEHRVMKAVWTLGLISLLKHSDNRQVLFVIDFMFVICFIIIIITNYNCYYYFFGHHFACTVIMTICG